MAEIDSRAKKRTPNSFGRNLTVWVRPLLKKAITRLPYPKKSMTTERTLTTASRRTLVGLTVRTPFRMTARTPMDAGPNDITNSFRLKKDEKTRLTTVLLPK